MLALPSQSCRSSASRITNSRLRAPVPTFSPLSLNVVLQDFGQKDTACAALRAPRYHRHIGSGKQGTAAGSGAIIFGRHLGIWKARQIKTS